MTNHPYDQVVSHLQAALAELDRIGVGDVLAKGGVGSVLLAHHLGHSLVPGDKGADAQDAAGCMFEYKVSITNQFNFNFGGVTNCNMASNLVQKHFAGLTGAYCGLRKGGLFVAIAYCPSAPLVADICSYLSVSRARSLVKNYSLDSFLALPGASRIL